MRELLTPVLELFRNTAALALLPVFTLLLGIGETSKIAIIAVRLLLPGPAQHDRRGGDRGSAAAALGARARALAGATFRKVVFPAAVPTIFTGIRISGAASILVLIAAEMVGAEAGLGFLINYAQFNFLIPKMYAAILATSVLGLAVNYSLVALERRFSRWRV